MKKSYVKVHYKKLSISGRKIPIYHSFLEIQHNKTKKVMGFYNKDHKSTLKSLLSLLWMTPSEIIPERINDAGVLLTTSPKKTKKLLSIINSKKYKWASYHALFKNCFHWRNGVLKEAGIPIPNDSWYRRAK